MENNEIKVGRSSFSKSELKKLTLKKAEEKFHYLDKRIVSKAWKLANPGVKETPISKKKTKKKTVKESSKSDKNDSKKSDSETVFG